MGCVSCKRSVPASESIDSPATGHQLEAGPTFYASMRLHMKIPKRGPLGQGAASWTPNPSEGSLDIQRRASSAPVTTCYSTAASTLIFMQHRVQKGKPSSGLEFRVQGQAPSVTLWPRCWAAQFPHLENGVKIPYLLFFFLTIYCLCELGQVT